MTTRTNTDTTPRAWIGCLACYNNARLVGEWFDAEAADEVTLADVHGGAHRRSKDPRRRSTVDRLQRPDAVEFELLLVYTGSTLAGLRHLVESAEDGVEVAPLAQLVLDKALHRLRRSSGQGQRDSTVIAV